jgi:hypothetical protein
MTHCKLRSTCTLSDTVLTSIQLGGVSRMMGEVLEQPDVGQGQVTRKERHRFHVDSVSGPSSQGHGDDATAFSAHCPVAAVVDN